MIVFKGRDAPSYTNTGVLDGLLTQTTHLTASMHVKGVGEDSDNQAQENLRTTAPKKSGRLSSADVNSRLRTKNVPGLINGGTR